MSKAVLSAALIEAVKNNPILWDSRRDEYKLAAKKPAVWEKIAEEVGCERSKYIQAYWPIVLYKPFGNLCDAETS
jgi:Alcohol dehydrogenase transcription factor Myb/SANT-like